MAGFRVNSRFDCGATGRYGPGMFVVFVAYFLVSLGTSQAQTRTEAQMSLRISELEAQVRAMTGEIERLNFRIRQLSGQQGGTPDYSGIRSYPPPGPPPPAYSGATLNPVVPNRSSATVGAPSAPLGTLTSGGDPSAPLNINPNNRFAQPQPRYADPDAPVNTGFNNPIIGRAPGQSSGQTPGQVAIGVPTDPRAEYDVAYAFILQRDYQSAETAFSKFLASYPENSLAGNAQYWLGETYYVRQMYRPAADAFLKSYTQHRAAQKAPDSLLKLGLSLVQLDQKTAACSTFSELAKKFPNASAAIRTRALREAERARC